MSEDSITLTRTELEAKIDAAVTKSQVGELTADLALHKKQEEIYLKEIFDKLRDLNSQMSDWSAKFSREINTMENDIMEKVGKKYMTREETISGFKAIKIWIVSSVGGFTAAGATIFYLISLRIIG